MTDLIYRSAPKNHSAVVVELEAIGCNKGLTIKPCSAFTKITNAWAFFNNEGKQKSVGMSLDRWVSRLGSGLSFDDIALNQGA